MDNPAWLARRPDTAAASAWERLMTARSSSAHARGGAATALSQHVQEILNHLVARRDHLGIGRVGLLGDDELGKLVGHVGIGALERRAQYLSRRAKDGRSRLVGLLKSAPIEAFEKIRAVEFRERNFRKIDGQA